MAQYYSGVSANPPQPHFLDACSLCRKPLSFNSDIFMYRGNTPFCSKECRQEQIEMDESREKKGWKVASSTSLRKSEQTTTDSSATKALRTSRVVVA